MLFWMLALAHANSWGPYDEGFVSPTRTDAPTDGQIIIATNFLPLARVVSGPGAPFDLHTELVTGLGSNPRTAIHPPATGWEPGAEYTVEYQAYYQDDGATQFTFTAGTEPAGPPPRLLASEPAAEAWIKNSAYVWGCCTKVRTVTVDVELPGADAWDRVELIGDFDLGRRSQITTEEINTHLWLEVGGGTHTLQVIQWVDEDAGIQPPCFDIVAFSASGEPGPTESFCMDESDDDEECGCETAPGSVGWGFAVLFALSRRRSRGAVTPRSS